MEGWKPLTTLARQAEVPEASARRYAETFSPYFRSRKVGKVRFYDPACMPLLRVISETYAQGSRTPEVEEVLSSRFGQVHEVVTPRQETTTSLPPADLAPILQAFTATVERLVTAVERQNELLEQLARAGGARPGESPPNSPQEAPGGPEGAQAELAVSIPESVSKGRIRLSWWKRLLGN